MPRQPVNNLVKNGDFEYAPTFVAPTSVGFKWIDGSGLGSTTNSIYGWYMIVGVSSIQSNFDSIVKHSGLYSIKLSATNITGRGRLMTTPFESNPGRFLANQYCISVLPNTSYTLSGWVKTNNVPSNSIGIEKVEFTSEGLDVAGSTVSTAKLSGTNDWTQVSLTWTTDATTRYVTVRAHLSVAGNICDAWFDDIKLDLTAGTTRQLVTRSAAGNRLTVRDSGTALRSDGTATNKVEIAHNDIFNFNTTGFTISALIKREELSTATRRVVSKRSGNNGFLIQTTNSGGFEVAVGNGTTLQTRALGPVGSAGNQWNLLTASYDLTNLKLYLNGVFVNQYALSSIVDAATTPLRFIGDTSSALLGSQDENRLWRRALLDAEISALYFYNVVPRTGLVGEWLFNEGSGTTALDTSDFGNNGTITGATYTTDVFMKPRQSA